MRNFDFTDEDLLAFIGSMDENQALKELLEQSDSADVLRQAVEFVRNFDSFPAEAEGVMTEFLDDICPEQCEGCCGNIPWSEMAEAISNGGYCGHCQHRMEAE